MITAVRLTSECFVQLRSNFSYLEKLASRNASRIIFTSTLVMHSVLDLVFLFNSENARMRIET